MREFVKTSLYLSLFAVVFTPLVSFDTLFFPAITSKAVFFYGVVQLALLLYFIHLNIDKDPLLPDLSTLVLILPLFVGLVGVSSLLSDNPMVSFFGDFERMDGWVTLLHLMILFLLTSALFTKSKIWDRFFFTSTGVSVIVFFSALFKYLETSEAHTAEIRVDVLFGNATFLGTYAMLHIFIGAYLATRQKLFSRAQVLLLSISLLNLATIIFSGTRAALIGVFSGLGVSFLVYFLKTDGIDRYRKIVSVFIIGLTLIIGAGVANHYRAELENVSMIGRLLHLTPETLTQQPRYYIWKAAIEGFQDKPFMGWGVNQFLNVYNLHYSPETKSRFNVAIGEIWIDRAHNMYLEWLVAGGLLSFGLYIFLLGYSIYVVLKRLKTKLSSQALLLGLLTAYMINNLFAFDSLSTFIIFFTLLGYIHFLDQSLNLKFKTPAVFSYLKTTVATIGVIIVVLAAKNITWATYTTASTVADFLRSGPGSEEQLQTLSSLTAPDTYAPWHVNMILAEEIRAILKTKKAEPDVALTLAEKITEKINSEQDEGIRDARTAYLYCRAVRQFGDLENAKELCLMAVESAPNTQDVLLELGQVYRDLAMYEESLEVIKNAYLGEPDYDPIRPEYAAALVYTGNIAEAHKILNERYGTHLIDDKSLLTAYTHIHAYSDALEIIEKHIKEDPAEIGYHISRVSIYLKLGQKDNAITAVKDLMELDKNFKKTGRNIIKQIEAGEDILGSNFPLE